MPLQLAGGGPMAPELTIPLYHGHDLCLYLDMVSILSILSFLRIALDPGAFLNLVFRIETIAGTGAFSYG